MLPNSNLNLRATYGIEIPISWDTARVWMHSLGFLFSDVTKDIYYDGHDRQDNILYRAGFLSRYFEWQDEPRNIKGYLFYTHQYVKFTFEQARVLLTMDDETISKKRLGHEDIVEVHVDDYTFDRETVNKFGGKLSLKIPFDGYHIRPIVIFIQDECIWWAYDASKKCWKQQGGGGIVKKGDGKGCMLSSFVCEEVGFVSFTESEWAEFLKFRRVKKGRTKDPDIIPQCTCLNMEKRGRATGMVTVCSSRPKKSWMH